MPHWDKEKMFSQGQHVEVGTAMVKESRLHHLEMTEEFSNVCISHVVLVWKAWIFTRLRDILASLL